MQEYRRSEETDFYRVLFDAIDVGFCVIEILRDDDGRAYDYRFLLANTAFEAHTGLGDAVGHTIRELVPDFEDRWPQHYDRIARSGVPERFRDDAPSLDGRTFEVFAFPLGAPGGSLVGVHFSDVTERQRLETRIVRQAAQLRSLIDQAPLGIWMLDDELTFLEVNPVGVATFDGREVVGRSLHEVLREVWPGDVADAVAARFRHTLATGEAYHAPAFSAERSDRHRGEHYDWRIDRIVLPGGGYGVVCYYRETTLQARAQEALRRSEEKYRTLFESIDTGFMIIEMLVDEAGEPSDWLILEGNPAQEKLTGLRGVAGQRISELVPGMERDWQEHYAAVALTGVPKRFVDHAEVLGRSFDVYAFKVGGREERTVALLFADVTERLADQARLQESEARNMFLVTLGDAVRAVADPIEVQSIACRLLGEHLDAARAMYFEVRGGTFVMERGHARGVPPMTGRYPIEIIGPKRLAAYQRGESVRVADVLAEDDLSEADRNVFVGHQIRALMTVPLVKGGRFVAGLVVHRTEQHAWRDDELRLVEETAERTWDAVERARVEAALRSSEERYRLLTDSLPEIVYAHDPDGNRPAFNRRWTEFTGLTRDSGNDMREIIRQIVHPDDVPHLRQVWERAVATERPVEFEFRLRSAATGRYHWFLGRSAPVRSRHGEVVQWVGSATDIDEQKRVEHAIRTREVELHHRAHHDPLTGLPNRLLFEDRLQLAVAAAVRHGRYLAVLFVDLDGFKLINDTFGHEAGDAVLEEVAARLRIALREGDTIARLHGDEFAVLLPELADPLDAGRLARTLLAQVERPVELGGRIVTVSASIGVSVFPRDGGDGLALLRAADVAMYKAKLGGKNDVRYFSPAMRTPAAERLALVEHLDGALERREMEMRFQPQWDARTGAVGSFEALLRWENPVVGAIPPARLVAVAEERGAFGPIFSWSLDSCASCASSLSRGLGMPVRVALNVTPGRVARSSFLPKVEAAMLRHALQPQQLEIELGLSAASDGAEGIRRTLEELRALGVRVTLDHFGADTGMVAPLLDLPLDGVKLDPQFVQRVVGDARLRRSLGAVIGLVHDLGLEVTAVGVETLEQRDVVLELGCERLQGLHIGPPLTDAAAARFLADQEVVTLF
jgi:diguanylate cyclase (GGDEF)-like protein/PAS domain S-box-containing protein